MKPFNFNKRNLISGPHLLGLLLIIAGLFALMSPVFFETENSLERILGVGGGAIILGLVIVLSYSGTLIDFNNRSVKEYTSIAGYKFGEWVSIPDILTVKVVSNSYMSTNNPNGISQTLSGKVTDFKILLYSNAPNPLYLFEYSNKSKAVKQAKLLASNLNADLVLNLSDKD